MRKTGGLEVTDRIKLGISPSKERNEAVEKFGDYIKNETLALELDSELKRPIKKEWNINGVKTIIAIEKD
jgi:hypothetical protein